MAFYRCPDHIVWTPKYWYRILEGLVKDQLIQDIPMLLEWRSCELIELNIQKDHIHLIVSMPPKISLSQLMGVLKRKTAIKIFKSYPQLKLKPYWGIIFGHEATVLTQSDLMKTKSRNTSNTKKSKNV